MAKKTRLIDTLQEEELQEVKEEQEKENSNTIKKAAVERIISRDGAKYVRENKEILEEDNLF